ncbi:MAG: hypothetical protein ACLPYW_06060 [Acidimicrobiales bacterium]
MFGDRFIHYLSYGATDQQTVVALAGRFDGLLVPGTVAAFQREGTGGFVLSLSASPSATLDYAIDPRFPLFQQSLRRPKKSHEALAGLLGAPHLIRSTDPEPEDFTPELLQTIARSWAEFNGGYPNVASGKFAKYARRLGEPLLPVEDARLPVTILPPYLVSHQPNDAWWTISQELFRETAEAAANGTQCTRVIAVSNVGVLERHALSVTDDRLAVWVSGLDELTVPVSQLAAYGRAIRSIASEGKDSFALYGGFFSVLLQNAGLGGSSHGIGYGESRQWIELPESGPPPARYYVPQLHRYLQPDEATRLLVADRRLAECDCPECNGDPPNTLEYHELMKHSVYCRSQEIGEWSDIGLGPAAARLRAETDLWHEVLTASGLPNVVTSAARARAAHLNTWIEALSRIE